LGPIKRVRMRASVAGLLALFLLGGAESASAQTGGSAPPG
jgi:hypothetical protein